MTTVILLAASANPWVVPSDCPTVVDKVEVWGAGASGAAGTGTTHAAGGGGGAYTFQTNVTVGSVGSNVSFQIGVGGTAVTASGTTGATSGKSGTATWFVSSATVNADFGVHGTTTTAGAGGLVANCVPTGNAFAGGSGVIPTTSRSGTGGGGCASSASLGASSTAPAINSGTAGGNSGTGGGTGGTAGTGASNGGAAANSTEGAGGGGGHGGNTSASHNGGAGGVPGGGGGGSADSNSTTQTSGAGGAGQIRITYTPVVAFTWRSMASYPDRCAQKVGIVSGGQSVAPVLVPPAVGYAAAVRVAAVDWLVSLHPAQQQAFVAPPFVTPPAPPPTWFPMGNTFYPDMVLGKTEIVAMGPAPGDQNQPDMPFNQQFGGQFMI